MENFAVEEEDGVEGLVLDGCGDVAVVGEVFEGMTLIMKVGIAAHPAYIGLFGAARGVLGA